MSRIDYTGKQVNKTTNIFQFGITHLQDITDVKVVNTSNLQVCILNF